MGEWAKGCLDGAEKTLEESLDSKLSTALDDGITLGWLYGAAKMDGFVGFTMEGWAGTLGDSDSINIGNPVLVHPILG